MLQFNPLPPMDAAASERAVEADQTNRSVVVGERVVVKWLTPPLPLPHPAPEIFAHLTAVGFTATALPYAALYAPGPGGSETLAALVNAYLPGAQDGWAWCVDDAAAGSTTSAGDLGRLAAGLHAAMATASDAIPHPVRRERRAAEWTARAAQGLEEALEVTGGEDGAWLAARAGALRRGTATLATAAETPLIRAHGDLHVGQVLRWSGGYAVIDFDGNPTVPDAALYQPAARDVAQLATSVEHVAQVAIRRRGAAPPLALSWAGRAREALLSAYRAELARRGVPWLLDESLLAAFEVEQLCRELIYAGRHLPRWRYAPMGVLRARYDPPSPGGPPAGTAPAPPAEENT
ncbi:hypothetical protein [Sphaerisporangium sp. TRM90804]|uniref:hypothetical protein n=1 Tax=Sphaerisporangium sp. TRM90804 TaxID=3031113 RepID=UPI00244B005A|nr:hypothetical protein [Sphaerisporangium sp. TRM90804]MDH2430070.1 hypothetical protein [Sphaerisporangium sp. TRM90804]